MALGRSPPVSWKHCVTKKGCLRRYAAIDANEGGKLVLGTLSEPRRGAYVRDFASRWRTDEMVQCTGWRQHDDTGACDAHLAGLRSAAPCGTGTVHGTARNHESLRHAAVPAAPVLASLKITGEGNEVCCSLESAKAPQVPYVPQHLVTAKNWPRTFVPTQWGLLENLRA